MNDFVYLYSATFAVAVDNHVSTAYGAVEQLRHMREKIIHTAMKNIFNLTTLVTYKVNVGDRVSVKPFFAPNRESDNRSFGGQVV